MTVDISKPILGQKSEPIKDKDGITSTVKSNLLLALSSPAQSHGESVESAVMIRRLFNRIDASEKEVEFKSEEIVKLKELSAKYLLGFVAGAVILELEPE